MASEIEEELAAMQGEYLDYAVDYAKALESGILKLYRLCREGRQEDGAMAWALLKALAAMAEANDLRGQLAAADRESEPNQ